MKTRTALAALLLSSASALSLAAPPAGAGLRGQVLEIRNVDGYTYLRLKAAGGETWAAVPTSSVQVGSEVTIVQPNTMYNFQSKTLGKTFDSIVFGQLAETDVKNASAHRTVPAAPVAGVPAQDPVTKASGADARTVAEVISGKDKLSGKAVLVRARVVKVNTGILGKNWLHLQDGSGTAAAGTHDILVTTRDTAVVGDIVHAKGKVRTAVDLGSGYTYPVMIDDASVRK